MSRKREARREKRHELARQLGVAAGEVDDHRHLQEHARVCRPVLRVVSHVPRGGVFGRLWSRPGHLVLALFLVDSKGARLLDVSALDAGERRLDKLTYHRPAHFVLVAITAPDPAPLVAAIPSATLLVDDRPIGDATLASAAWETPRRARIGGLPIACTGVVLSVRGVARVDERVALPLLRSTATVELEV